jgi:hypothetical protein
MSVSSGKYYCTSADTILNNLDMTPSPIRRRKVKPNQLLDPPSLGKPQPAAQSQRWAAARYRP